MCSNHGQCVQGRCYCEFGWKGQSCGIAYTADQICPAKSIDCSGHGSRGISGNCLCEDNWTGDNCDIGKLEIIL